jgi:hypothetical protein
MLPEDNPEIESKHVLGRIKTLSVLYIFVDGTVRIIQGVPKIF